MACPRSFEAALALPYLGCVLPLPPTGVTGHPEREVPNLVRDTTAVPQVPADLQSTWRIEPAGVGLFQIDLDELRSCQDYVPGCDLRHRDANLVEPAREPRFELLPVLRALGVAELDFTAPRGRRGTRRARNAKRAGERENAESRATPATVGPSGSQFLPCHVSEGFRPQPNDTRRAVPRPRAPGREALARVPIRRKDEIRPRVPPCEGHPKSCGWRLGSRHDAAVHRSGGKRASAEKSRPRIRSR
jgi:hypothetical protein